MENEKVLYLTTTGRVTGQPREIEIWFVGSKTKLYVLAERYQEAQWVKNIARNRRVRIRIGPRMFEATARVLDKTRDRRSWYLARKREREKYGWGDGLPVEIILEKELTAG